MVDFQKALDARRQALSKKIAALGKAQAVNLNPTPWVPRTPHGAKVEEVVPTLEDVLEDRAATAKARLLVTRLVALKVAQRQAKTQQEPLTEDLKRLLAPHGRVKAQVGETRLNYYSVTRQTIDKSLLLARGVSPEDIAAATVPSTTWVLNLSLPGQEDEETDE